MMSIMLGLLGWHVLSVTLWDFPSTPAMTSLGVHLVFRTPLPLAWEKPQYLGMTIT